MKNLIWYIFAGTRGGTTRARIVSLLKRTPLNANRISDKLGLDYKTVRHHLRMLEKNSILYAIDKSKYGAVYFLTEQFKAEISIFEDILNKIRDNLG